LEHIFLVDGDADSSATLDPREYRVVGIAQLGHGTVRLMLEGITDANLAEALKGKNVFADERELPPPAEGEFYYRDAIGCEVFLTDGRRLGAIEEVIATGANDVFVVRDDGKEVLVPVIADVVKEIDVAGSGSSSKPSPACWTDPRRVTDKIKRHETRSSSIRL